MVWEENSRICLHMQLIAILSRIGVRNNNPEGRPDINKNITPLMRKYYTVKKCNFSKL